MGIFFHSPSGVRPASYCVTGDANMRCAMAQDLIRPHELVAVVHPKERFESFRYGAALVVSAKMKRLFSEGRLRYNSDEAFCDLWRAPKLTWALGYGDCEDLSFVVASLLAALGCEPVIVIGQMLVNGRWVGHAWVEGSDRLGGFLIEATNGQLFRGGDRPFGYAPELFVTRYSCRAA